MAFVAIVVVATATAMMPPGSLSLIIMLSDPILSLSSQRMWLYAHVERGKPRQFIQGWPNFKSTRTRFSLQVSSSEFLTVSFECFDGGEKGPEEFMPATRGTCLR